MSEQGLQVPPTDASRLEWARYFLASAEEDVQHKAQALTWSYEQAGYHQVKVRQYLADCRNLEAGLKAARAEVERLEGVVAALEAASVDAAHD
jgi:hypothetical protein